MSEQHSYLTIRYLALGLLLVAAAYFILVYTSPKVSTLPSSKPLPNSSITLRFVGDIMMGRHVGVISHQKQDWTWAFRESLHYLSPADYLVGNLEFPIVANCPYTSTGMVFCAPPESIIGLNYAGFNLVSLANNHSGNYGLANQINTKKLLAEHDINSLDQYETSIQYLKNIPIGFLALNDTYGNLDEERVIQSIKDLTTKANIIVVLPHWGTEYRLEENPRQSSLAQSWLSAGATLIIGSHPHVIEPIKEQANTLIAYSLGNYIFDQMWSVETTKGLILDVILTFDQTYQLQSLRSLSHPITIRDYGQATLE